MGTEWKVKEWGQPSRDILEVKVGWVLAREVHKGQGTFIYEDWRGLSPFKCYWEGLVENAG